MAKTVTNRETVTFADDRQVELRPLSIAKMRKFAKIMTRFQELQIQQEKIEDEGGTVEELSDESFDILVDACNLCLVGVKGCEDIAVDPDSKDLTEEAKANARAKLEDVLDIPTVWKVLEVSGGVKQNPNLVNPTA